ncbi:DUF998 domain-containing protein [Micromonospora sonneratiae]|uniref:DUF998 domain-containing protein n=1 Tax=Micromonospora sonneratiae TaxID=1184706 RepID=A0ABW3YJX5_9ACTN
MVGAGAVTVAVVAGPGPGLTGYVSEAGIATSAYASTFQLGMFSLAAALFLFATALPPTLRPAAALLALSGLSTVLSGAVTCTDGCPLPPFERATTADLVHGGAAIAAVAASVFAMLVIVVSPRAPRSLRRLSVLAAAFALPLSATVGIAILTLGRGRVVGVVERLLLANVMLWVLTAAVVVVIQHRRAVRLFPRGQ